MGTPSELGNSPSSVKSFAFSYCSWSSPGKNTGNGLPFPPLVDHVLSELFPIINLSWVTLHSMAHSFIEICKPICHSPNFPSGDNLPNYAAAAKSLQSCPTLCDPIDGSPSGSPVPGILQARILEWIAIYSSNA